MIWRRGWWIGGMALAMSAAGVGSALGASGGSRPASAAERAAIERAYVTSPLGGVNRVPRSHYRVTGVRVSRLAPDWATAQQVPRPAFRGTLQGAYGVLLRLPERPGAAGPWVLVDVGTASVGCTIAPARVLAGLRVPCPPGEGF
jgi:hypothetical protein